MVFVPPLALEKWKKSRRFVTPLHNLQMRGAFIASFSSERLVVIKKFIPQLATDTEFFHRAFVNPCTM
jgi:hypothetical protein